MASALGAPLRGSTASLLKLRNSVLHRPQGPPGRPRVQPWVTIRRILTLIFLSLVTFVFLKVNYPDLLQCLEAPLLSHADCKPHTLDRSLTT